MFSTNALLFIQFSLWWIILIIQGSNWPKTLSHFTWWKLGKSCADVNIWNRKIAFTSKHFFPSFLSPDQRDPHHFFHFESVTSLPGSDRQDSRIVTPIRGDRPLEAKPRKLTRSNPEIKAVFHLQISPHKEKSAHITVCKKRTASEQSETLQSPPTVCGNCLVPKLNWRMHCNSNCFCLSISFFYLLCYGAIKFMSKGKVRQI